jgi:uncharacterized membrane protein YfcA
MLVGSAPLSLVGVQIASSFSDSTQSVMGRVVGGALIAGGLGFAIKTFIRGYTGDAPLHLNARQKSIAVGIGATCGFVVGLTSVGSGTFFGLVMMIAFPLTAAKIVGTDLFQAALLLWVAGFGHFVTGSVDLGATGWLLIGSIPGVLLCSQLTVRLPDRALRVALSLVLSLSGVKLLDPPYANAIVVAVSSVAILAGLVLAGRWYLRRGLVAQPRVAADDLAV